MKNGNHLTLTFATSNPHKVQEVQLTLTRYSILIKQLDMKGPEIQAEALEDIVKYSVLWAVQKINTPIFVEDTGLFIEALNGFPGTMAAQVYRTIGTPGILKLLKGERNRVAQFKSVIAYCTPHNEPSYFKGEVLGRITLKERGSRGFGFDSIFEPEGSNGKTFGEMDTTEKNKYSHRARATIKFAQWVVTAR
jgi:XTP/dITP diphosphohydrolase